MANNVVPDLARLTFNHRFAPDRTADEAFEWLRSYLAPVILYPDKIHLIDFAPAAPPSLMSPDIQRLVKVSGVEPRGKVGWTDVATFHEIGIPAANFGAGNPLLAHRPNEYVTLAELDKFADDLEQWLVTTSPTNLNTAHN